MIRCPYCGSSKTRDSMWQEGNAWCEECMKMFRPDTKSTTRTSLPSPHILRPKEEVEKRRRNAHFDGILVKGILRAMAMACNPDSGLGVPQAPEKALEQHVQDEEYWRAHVLQSIMEEHGELA